MNLDSLVDGLDPTVKSYWELPRKRKQRGTVLRIACEEDFCYVILEQTLFHPETDEQEGDSGEIRGENGVLEVRNTLVRSGVIIHEGKIEGELRVSEEVEAEVYWPSRKKHERMHALGHFLRAAIMELKPEAEITDFRMSIPGFIRIKGGLNQEEVDRIRAKAVESIREEDIHLEFISGEEFAMRAESVPGDLPLKSIIRVCEAGSVLMTCGGILPESISELDFKIIGMRGDKLVFDL